MSDYHDYHENLAFPPIGSQDDLNEQGRQSEVLIAALEKCEKLEKQLKIAVECLEYYGDECLYEYWEKDYEIAQDALAKIKELDK